MNRDACWVCGCARSRLARARALDRPLAPDDLRISDARYGLTLELRRCAACGFLYARGEDVAELTSLYRAMDDDGYVDSEGPRRVQMRWLVDRARHLHPAARSLLDVGAGSGLLVAAATDVGMQAVGVEPSRSLARRARTLGVGVHEGVLPHAALDGHRFDIVTLIDVIEHVADPIGLLRGCAARLRPDGRLIVVTPDVSSLAARLLGARWWHARLAHVSFFEPRTLTSAAAGAGLEPVSSLRPPWTFELGYLAERLEAYAPVGPLRRAVAATPVLRSALGVHVPLNLHDSLLMALKRRA